MTTTTRLVRCDFGAVEVGWDGVPLNQELLAIDTETDAIVDNAVPRLVLVSASDGERHVVFPPDQLPGFLRAHNRARWVVFNVKFDFWVLHEELKRQRGAEDLIELLWSKAQGGGIADPMLLAMLLETAEHGTIGSQTGRHSLESLCRANGVDIGINKEADEWYRLNYKELLGVDFDAVADEGWFIYAGRDALAAVLLYDALAAQVLDLEDRLQQDLRRWGPLTETIQVQAAIALAAATRNGVWVDKSRVEVTQSRLREEMRRHVEDAERLLGEDRRFGSVLPVFRFVDGDLKYSRKSLQTVLGVIRSDIESQTGRPLHLCATKGGGITTSTKEWGRHVFAHPFLRPWIAAGRTQKLLGLLPETPGQHHPHYRTLVATGRTSCSKPNIQQIPRDSCVRAVYVAGPGKVLISADYSAVELVTLAQVCLDRYGSSKLAEMIASGKDPHSVTAAGLLGVDYEAFLENKSTDPVVFKTRRQQAKAVNFGVPGGMGVDSLRSYALQTYGVELTPEEAKAYKQKLTSDIFPELGLYLADNAMLNLCTNLRCTEEELVRAYGEGQTPPWFIGLVCQIVRGQTQNSAGQPYRSSTVERVWDALAHVNRNPDLIIEQWRAGEVLKARLFASTVVLQSGRVRGNCSYTKAHNTPFQGLAADGAKLAIFELTRRGYRVVGFVHDEIVIEVDETDDLAGRGSELRQVMVEQMRRVTPDVPVGIGEAKISRSWAKD